MASSDIQSGHVPRLQVKKLDEAMKTLSPEHKAKMMAGRSATKTQFAEQVISVDENWQIRRADAYNWEIRHKIKGKWEFVGFYGKLDAAFMALPAHLLGSEASGALQQVLESQKAIRLRITQSLHAIEKFQSI
jgi:hypothetical protein